ncbi:CRISPR-associated protein Cas1 [Cricetibacter osteomyelitidis]|uniref:CRISPR-associated endonuclease Cas1 n=1 Tax=Cricetibacter osteomyelitidis TaxID=1521931 RepID=A0A4R2SPJ3_9PAST|nr:CRISPR-associated endonuclease Cas1 [Cricetibacter osteomyelitidis]TCP90136.1 CRISPR-associated protein Cas1 [Cricetibacter osteomyelitidis]
MHKERETLVVEQDRKKVAQLPIHSIGHIFCFGNVLVSPFLMGFCGENNVNLAFFTENGRYLGRLQGRQSGNVLLRRAQYKVSEQNPVPIARNIIAAKIQASKRVLQRQIRNHGENADLQSAITALNYSLRQLEIVHNLDLIRGIEGDAASRYAITALNYSLRQLEIVHNLDLIRGIEGDAASRYAITALNYSLRQLEIVHNLDLIRGIEGDAASRYFGVFSHLIKANSGFHFDGHNRRPPRDGVNALLSLLYSIVGKDISGALQGVGLDPQIGFLHADRPGRDSLAQDILEEFRAWWADRMVLSLINRGQIKPGDFVTEAGGAVMLKPEARKLLFQTLQAKKQEKITHPFLGEEVEIGLLPYIQAMLLARHLRGDLAEYPPFLMR